MYRAQLYPGARYTKHDPLLQRAENETGNAGMYFQIDKIAIHIWIEKIRIHIRILIFFFDEMDV